MPDLHAHHSIVPGHGSILQRALRHSFLLAASTVLVLATTSFVIARSLLRERVLAQVAVLASTGEDSIENALFAERERGSLLAAHVEVREALRIGFTPPSWAAWFAGLEESDPSLHGIALFRNGKRIAGVGAHVNEPWSIATATTIVPTVNAQGWESYDIVVPIREVSGDSAILVLHHAPDAILALMRSSLSSLGETADVFLGVPYQGGLLLLHPTGVAGDIPAIFLGSLAEQYRYDLPLARALFGEEGIREAEDHRGRDVLTGQRLLPTLGWSLVVQVERDEALVGVRRLAILLTAIGSLLFVLAGLFGYLLARELVQPLRLLTKNVRVLRPGHWGFRRTVHTGDEVEVLDTVVADLASRLKKTYECLEDEVAARTEELRQQYVLDRAILEGIQQGVLTVDKDAIVTGVNPAALRLIGSRRENIVGKDVTRVLPLKLGRDGTPPLMHPVIACLRTKRACHANPHSHLSLVKHDKSLLPIMLLVSPLSERGQSQGAVAVLQDITEERRIDEMKSEFISLASHQLRTPLSILRWYMDLLTAVNTKLPREEQTYIHEMKQAVIRMINLLNALLQVAKLEEGNIKPEFQSVDAKDLCKEVIREIRELAAGKSMSCSQQISAKAGALWTDPALLRVVLQNLLTNSVKYSRPGGKIQLTLSGGEHFVCFTIEDTGIGIPGNEQQHVFQKFFRAQNVKQIDTDGSGLGLYICKVIVDALKGKISFRSVEGRGTSFTVKIPVPGKRKK